MSINSIHRWVFVIERNCVFFEVSTEVFLLLFRCNSRSPKYRAWRLIARTLAAETLVRSQVSPCEICGRKTGRMVGGGGIPIHLVQHCYHRKYKQFQNGEHPKKIAFSNRRKHWTWKRVPCSGYGTYCIMDGGGECYKI